MNYALIFKLLLLTLLVSCNFDSTNSIDYCERVEADQLKRVKKNPSEEEIKQRFEKRLIEFKKNWKILDSIIEKDQMQTASKDSCFTIFVSSTLVHNAQQFPETVFKKKSVDQLSAEMNKGNIMSDHLELLISFYAKFTSDEKRCNSMKEKVAYAIKTWNIYNIGIDEIVFVDCLKLE